MKIFIVKLFGYLFLVSSAASMALADCKLRDGSALSDKPAFMVSYIDFAPEQFPPCKRQANESGTYIDVLVERLTKVSTNNKGIGRFDMLTQSQNITALEQWNSEAERAAHQVADDVKHFRIELSGINPSTGINSDPLLVLNHLTGNLYDKRLY